MPPYSPLLSSPTAPLCLPPLNYDSHPPFSVLLVLPLGLLSRAAAALFWSLLVLACYLTTGALLLKALGWWTLRGAALFVVGNLFWNPFGGSLDAQNYAELVLLLVLGAWLLERKGHAGWAGVALGVAALLKIWPLALLCIVLARRRYKLALVGGGVVALGTLVTLVAFGPQTYATYLGPVLRQEAADIPHEVNVSLVAAIARPWTGFNDPSVIAFPPLLSGLSASQATLLGEGVAALVVLGTLALVAWGLRRRQDEAMEWVCLGIVVTVLLLGFPITWNWGMMSLLLPLGTTALALRSLPRPPLWWFILLGVSLVFLVNPEWLPFFIAHQQPLAGSVVFALPTLALLLFALAQAQLLIWAAAPLPVHPEEQVLASV
jgi:hypothetical protein